MQRKTLLIWLLALVMLLAACGGADSAEPAVNSTEEDPPTTDDSGTAAEEEDSPASEPESPAEEAPAEEDAPPAEESAETEEETPAEESDPAAEADSPWADRPLSGVDPESGLTVNPPVVSPGDTVLIRGEIISMNLTPTTSPEFLIRSQEGVNYRIRSQDLNDTTYEDGTEIPPHLFQKGMLAQATITLASDATLTDLAISEDLVIISVE